jgi:adenylate cyclase
MTATTTLGMRPPQEPTTAIAAPFRLGEWQVEPSANELARGGETVRLEPKAMRVLCLLAARPGGVLSREELEAEAWPGMVVTSDALTNAIIKLRKALGDEARNPRYIETVSKSGYRLIAEVGPGAEAAPAPSGSGRSRWIAVALLLLALAMVGLVLLRGFDDAPAPGAAGSLPERRPGIAVLPFENLGGDPGQDWFAHGMADDLITDLSGIHGLRVVARNSTFAYEGSTEPETRIARELGVDYLLQGSVQRAGGRVRINVRLTDGDDGGNLWAQRFDRAVEDIFDIQDEIAERVTAALEVEIGPDDPARTGRDRELSVQAYDEFLRALDYYGRRSLEDASLAIEHFRRAIALDPGFARAYAGLALVYARNALRWHLTSPDALVQAAELTEKARRLDPSVPQIYFVEGLIELFRRNYDEALENAQHAISIKPSYADAHALVAWILHFAGHPEDGLASMKEAVRLNPRVPAMYRLVRGALQYSAGAIDEALVDLERGVEMNPQFQLLRTWLAAAYAAAGRMEEASWEVQEIMVLDPDFTLTHVRKAFPIRDARYRDRFLSDLRRAGLPE